MSAITPLQFCGIVLAASTLVGGSFWLLDGLITDHVPARLWKPIGGLLAAAIIFGIAFVLHAAVTNG